MPDLPINEPLIIEFYYRNYKGETEKRRAMPYPNSLHYGATEYHSMPGWYVKMWDVDRQAERDFMLRDFCGFCDKQATMALLEVLKNVTE